MSIGTQPVLATGGVVGHDAMQMAVRHAAAIPLVIDSIDMAALPPARDQPVMRSDRQRRGRSGMPVTSWDCRPRPGRADHPISPVARNERRLDPPARYRPIPGRPVRPVMRLD